MTRLLKVIMTMGFLPIASSAAEYELLLYHDQTGDASIVDNEIGVRKGNGLVQDSNETSLWITQKDGSLRIIPLPFDSNGNTRDIHFRPHVLTNRRSECVSSVFLHENDGVVEYGVYAIVDRPQSKSAAVVSRVLAISPSGDQLWEAILEGIVEGMPQINKDGSRIYVTHNNKNRETGNYTDGKISMIRHEFGTKSGVDLDGDLIFGIQDYKSPFAPLTISNIDGDFMYFGEKWNDGSASYGSTYECNGTHVRALIRTSWSTAAAPTLAKDGKSMWMVGAKSSVHGWVDAPFDGRATWSAWLGDDDNSITLGPLLTPDEGLIFVLTVNKTVACLNARNGDRLWSINDEMLEPNIIQLSPDGLFLYAIGNSKGIVAQFEATSGQIIHTFSCLDIVGYDSCTAPTEGSFVISRKRNAIYFGDIYGDIFGILIHPENDPVPQILIDPEENRLSQQVPGFVQGSLTLLDELLTPSATPTFQFPTSPTSPPSPVYMPATAWMMSPAQTPASLLFWSPAIPWEYYEENASAPSTLSNPRANDIDNTVTSPVVVPAPASSSVAGYFGANPSSNQNQIGLSSPISDDTTPFNDGSGMAVTSPAAMPTLGETDIVAENPTYLSSPISDESTPFNDGSGGMPVTSPVAMPTLGETDLVAENPTYLSSPISNESTPFNDGSGGIAVTSPVAMPTLGEAEIVNENPTYLPKPISDESTPFNDGSGEMAVTSPVAMLTLVEETDDVDAEDPIDLSNPSSEETDFLQTPYDEVDLVYFEVDLESEMKGDSNLESQKEPEQSSSSSENKSVAVFVVSLSIGVIAIMVSGVILGRLWHQGRDELRRVSPRDEDDYSLKAKLNL